jgi:hypothetical protein
MQNQKNAIIDPRDRKPQRPTFTKSGAFVRFPIDIAYEDLTRIS